jgi:hypothetical protein
MASLTTSPLAQTKQVMLAKGLSPLFLNSFSIPHVLYKCRPRGRSGKNRPQQHTHCFLSYMAQIAARFGVIAYYWLVHGANARNIFVTHGQNAQIFLRVCAYCILLASAWSEYALYYADLISVCAGCRT